MTFDAKTIGIIFTFLTSLGGGCTWLYSTGKETGELSAKEQLRKEYDTKYETVIVDYITLRANCPN